MLSKEALSTIFWVFDMTQPGIELQSPEPLANTLTKGRTILLAYNASFSHLN